MRYLNNKLKLIIKSKEPYRNFIEIILCHVGKFVSEKDEKAFHYLLNPRTYTQTYIPTVIQREGGGDCCTPSPRFLRCYNVWENFLLLIDSLSCDLKDEVYIMGRGTAGCP